jgi:16S rRNA (adenine1518-N6/adenine1519-N6)-dimethyltransferase
MLRARKRFGQHFLHDNEVLGQILDAINPGRRNNMVEIGPGHGALTDVLIKYLNKLTVIEIDRDLAAELTAHYADKSIEIRNEDALQVDFTALRGAGEKLRVVGNLPYNISTPLMFHLLEHVESIHDMHFMLQKEVVDRMAAKPGSRAYGRLTVMLAPWVQVESLFNVPPTAFRPQPKVDSAVVRLTPWAAAPFDIGDGVAFAKVVKTAFSQRRKTLRNALKGMRDEAQMAACEIDPGVRPEQLSAAQFARLALVGNEPVSD